MDYTPRLDISVQNMRIERWNWCTDGNRCNLEDVHCNEESIRNLRGGFIPFNYLYNP